jgi:hypothetical protein
MRLLYYVLFLNVATLGHNKGFFLMTKAGWDDSVAPIAAAKRWLKTSREEPGS